MGMTAKTIVFAINTGHLNFTHIIVNQTKQEL